MKALVNDFNKHSDIRAPRRKAKRPDWIDYEHDPAPVDFIPVESAEAKPVNRIEYEVDMLPTPIPNHPMADTVGAFANSEFFDAVVATIEAKRKPWWKFW